LSTPSSNSAPADLLPWVALVTAIGSVLGTISTIILAWKADRRTAKESELKLVQMQQQIKELEAKLTDQMQAKRVILP
jgi:hypothetical protein